MLLQKIIVKKYLALLNKEQKLTLAQQDEWEDYFNQYRQAYRQRDRQQGVRPIWPDTRRT